MCFGLPSCASDISTRRTRLGQPTGARKKDESHVEQTQPTWAWPPLARHPKTCGKSHSTELGLDQLTQATVWGLLSHSDTYSCRQSQWVYRKGIVLGYLGSTGSPGPGDGGRKRRGVDLDVSGISNLSDIDVWDRKKMLNYDRKNLPFFCGEVCGERWALLWQGWLEMPEWRPGGMCCWEWACCWGDGLSSGMDQLPLGHIHVHAVIS